MPELSTLYLVILCLHVLDLPQIGLSFDLCSLFLVQYVFHLRGKMQV